LKTIGVYLNPLKKSSANIGKKVISFLEEKQVEILMLEDQGRFIENKKYEVTYETFYSKPEMIIVLGGDGTMLGVARRTYKKSIPILGINLGKLGFLTEIETDNIEEYLEKLLNDDFTIEKRMMLNCDIISENGEKKTFVALNDIVLKSASLRMVVFDIQVSGYCLDQYAADGLIISSPTGSTAYSLSAGGPVVHPETNLMIINPICPHTMHNRSHVVDESDKVIVSAVEDVQEMLVTIDGQKIVNTTEGDKVHISKSSYSTYLIRINQLSFYDRLRKKLSV
jgi:NAD+ kinase